MRGMLQQIGSIFLNYSYKYTWSVNDQYQIY